MQDVSVILNDYLREFRTKLESRLEHLKRVESNADASKSEKTKSLKEVERLRKIIDELETWEHDVLYPLATQQIEINLDDGVKVNYPKFGTALKKITGKHLVGKAEYWTQVPDSDCRSKCSSYAGRLWAASVQSGKLSHQAVVRKTAPIPVRGGAPSVMQSPPSRLVARVGHLDLPQLGVPIGRGGWTNLRELENCVRC